MTLEESYDTLNLEYGADKSEIKHAFIQHANQWRADYLENAEPEKKDAADAHLRKYILAYKTLLKHVDPTEGEPEDLTLDDGTPNWTGWPEYWPVPEVGPLKVTSRTRAFDGPEGFIGVLLGFIGFLVLSGTLRTYNPMWGFIDFMVGMLFITLAGVLLLHKKSE